MLSIFRHRITGSGVPDHPLEAIPGNPGMAMNQNYNFTIPRIPVEAQTPGCVPMDIIAITRTGVGIYNPLNGQSENAVEGQGVELFDSCDGHPGPGGRYHYHKLPDSCLYRGEVDEFIGVAFDGYPIYGPNVSFRAELLTSHDLDDCHGTNESGQYRYYVTNEFPYFLGCFKGVVENIGQIGTVSHDCNEASGAGRYSTLLFNIPRVDPKVKSRMFPPYPQDIVKGD